MEKDKCLELEKQLQLGCPTSPDSKGNRRRWQSRKKPHREDEPLEAINQDMVTVQPDWDALSEVIAQYAEATRGVKTSDDSTLLAEEVSPQQSEDKWEERHKLCDKHRMFLFATQAVDSSLEACEDKIQGI